MKKLNSCFLIFLLIFSILPQEIFAQTHTANEEIEKLKVVLFADEIGQEIELFENIEAVKSAEAFVHIPDDTIVEVLEDPSLEELSQEELYLLQEYALIGYVKDIEDSEEDLIFEGYVKKDYIVELEKADDFRNTRDNIDAEEPVIEKEVSEEDSSDDLETQLDDGQIASIAIRHDEAISIKPT